MCTGCVHGNCTHYVQAMCTGIEQDAHVGSSMRKNSLVFPGTFFNEWILIWEHPDHRYEFQISISLFYNGF